MPLSNLTHSLVGDRWLPLERDQNLLIGDMSRSEEVAAFQVRAMMLREVNATLQTNLSHI